MIRYCSPSLSNALRRFYGQAKNKEEAEKLVEYIDVFFNVKAKEMMEQYVTKDFLRAELSQITAEMSQLRAEISAEMSQLRVEMSQLSESLTKQFHNMMVKIILTILIPLMLMMLGIYLK